MKRQFFVFGSLWEHCEAQCADLLELENCEFYNTPTINLGGVLYALYRIHTSGRVNSILRLPGKRYWYRYYFDFNKIQKNGVNYFIFFDSNDHVYNPDFLSFLKSDVPNSRLILFFGNSMHMRTMRDIGYFRKFFDLIYTYDRADAREYGFIYWEQIFSVPGDTSSEIKYDLVYCGTVKNREKECRTICELLLRLGLKCNLTIVGLDHPPAGVNTNRISYKELLQLDRESRAILEICDKNQKGITLRAIEAIAFDKYLITNNRSILESDFYHPDMVKYIDTDQELTINDFMIPDVLPGYHYSNQQSPIMLLEDIVYRDSKIRDG